MFCVSTTTLNPKERPDVMFVSVAGLDVNSRMSSYRARVLPRVARDRAFYATLLLAVSLCTVAAPRARAQDRPAGVSITGGYAPGTRLGVMVLPINGVAGDSLKLMMERDLDYSDRFQHVPSIATPAPNQSINYGLVSSAGAAVLVQGQLLPSGWLRVLVHDVGAKKLLQQNDFPLPTAANTDNWRMGVHRISDQIEEWVTGQKGMAATRISFTREERIWVVDSDGANARPVTPRGLGPAWHPSGRYIVYYAFDEDRIRLYVTDVITGAQRSLTNEKGANDVTPAVSPDGRSVVFSRSIEATAGSTDLFVMPFDGGRPSRVSVSRGSINLAPGFSPDSRRLTFSSDRSGRNEIYIADADGTNVSLLTAAAYGERNVRADPAWSPDGRYVAMSSEVGGTQQILILSLSDRSLRQVTSDGRNAAPAWAPDGRHLVFSSTRGGSEQLWVADIETGRTRQLTRGARARFGDWSPRLVSTP